MHCKFDHEHPPREIIAATNNPIKEPHGEPRPFHCPSCPQTRKITKKNIHWETYYNLDEAGLAGHQRPCRICF